MRILLLQKSIYVPALAGSNKGSRELLEMLAARGHSCIAVAASQSTHGPRNRAEFQRELRRRQIAEITSTKKADVFKVAGVEIHAIEDSKAMAAYVPEVSEGADCILVNADDPAQTLLEAALNINPSRTALIVRTTLFLPFGLMATIHSDEMAKQIGRVRTIICNSQYIADYVRKYFPKSDAPQPRIISLPLPVMGLKTALATREAAFDSGFITIINPSAIKGISIFIELARRFPDLPFAAVPTWATTQKDLDDMARVPNIRVLDPVDDINCILSQTRILLAPSLWDEAFGRIIVEGMLQTVPVLASNVGGIPEAKLGVDYVLPVRPVEKYQLQFDEKNLPIPVIPEQDIGPWEAALREIISDKSRYDRLAAASREAAVAFVSAANISDFETVLRDLVSSPLAPPAAPAKSPNTLPTLTQAERTALALKALEAKRKKLSAPATDASPLPRSPGQTRFPAAPVQQSLYFLQMADQKSAAYHLSLVIQITGAINKEILESALNKLIERHEPLRTNFRHEADGVSQTIASPRPLTMVEFDSTVDPQKIISNQSQIPFDLQNDLLLRAALIRTEPDRSLLVLTLHHLVCDGRSVWILYSELLAIYESLASGKPPAVNELQFQFADFCVAQQRLLAAPAHNSHLDYWKKQLEGAHPILNLPFDNAAASLGSEAARESVELPSELSAKLTSIGRAQGATNFMTFLAAFNVFLHRVTGAADISVGSPVNLRTSAFSDCLGFFVNTVVLRTRLESKTRFVDLLEQNKKNVAEAIAHRDAPLDSVVAALNPTRAGHTSPLFNVLFGMAGNPLTPKRAVGLLFEPLSTDSSDVKTDLWLFVTEKNERQVCVLEYRKNSFRPQTIQNWLRHFEKLLNAIANDPSRSVESLGSFIDANTPPSIHPTSKIAAASSPSKNVRQPITDARELQIAGIWKSLLKAQTIARHDNFFDLGGHSLLAIRLIAKIKETLGQEIPLGAFLEQPTIAGISSALASRKNENKALVLLREGDASPPLFLVHAHSGQPLRYMPLVHLLKTSRPIFGFQSRALVSGNEDPDIETIATRYVAEIRSVQPCGPYFIAGYCMGGLLSYEMARQLRSAGEEVAFLGVIQAFAPPERRICFERSLIPRLALKLLSRVEYEFENFFHMDPEDNLRLQFDRLERLNRSVLVLGERLRGKSLDVEPRSNAAQLQYLQKNYFGAVKTYDPKPLPGDMTLFRAKIQHRGARRHSSLGWSKLVGGQLTIYTVPGHSITLMSKPNVQVLARQMDEALAAAANQGELFAA